MNKKIVLLIATFFNLSALQNFRYVGIFYPSHEKINGIKFGNWGSRPYEYAWAASIIPIEGKRVIDLGVGLPSQYNWYNYVINNLKPSFYAGIDCDARIIKEQISEQNYEIKYMNMAEINYPDKSFDIAYCISTYEHIPYKDFMQSMKETHRILKDNGILIITLDEEWDMSQPTNYSNGWNTLELSLLKDQPFERKNRSFGLPEFLSLIDDYFILYQENTIIRDNKIVSKDGSITYYDRKDKDNNILHSNAGINSCVSYAVLQKKS